ncbi:MAG: hypothetical protein Q9217_005850 [Psora testacea]
MEVTKRELTKEMPLEKGGFTIALGGVASNFRREIKPLEKFEIWTRVLAWDRKWLYIVGHFVKSERVRPKTYLYQPWKKTGYEQAGNSGSVGDGNGTETEIERKARAAHHHHPAIFASSIAKYVFKKGRLTIPPERVLRASQLLPPKPADHESPSVSETPVVIESSLEGASGAAISAAEKLTPDMATDNLAASLTPKDGEDVWDWERVENERMRGMKVAELYRGLDALNEEFVGEGATVLGRY